MKATYDLFYSAGVGEFILYLFAAAVIVRLLKEIILHK